VWNVDEMSYVETLYGHQDAITSIVTLNKERCLTNGSRDRTMRLWKIAEESQLVYRGSGTGNVEDDMLMVVDDEGSMNVKKRKKNSEYGGGSVDVVCMVDEDTFLSGTDSGAISIWSAGRKKPLYTRLRCHGSGEKVIDGETASYCHWIVSLAAVPYSDLFCSGSSDGTVRFWKISADKKSFDALFSYGIVCCAFV
jgi:ribosomal RNA-processing protein 9